MSIKAIFFDLDATLIDCADLHYEALNRALRDSFFAEIEREEHLRLFNGLPTKDKLQLLAQRGRIGKHDMGGIAILKQRYTVEMAPEHVVPDPVKMEMCRELCQDYLLAVVSNCVRDSVTMLISLAGLSDYFRFAVSNQDIVKAKPAPDPYLWAMSLLDKYSPVPIAKAEVLVIEDNEKGVQSAQAAGLEVVQLQYPYITLDVMRAVIKAAENKLTTE